MQTSVTLKSLFVLAAFTLGAHCAHAEDHCFEDGLQSSWSAPAPSIKLGHSESHEGSFGEHSEHRFDERFEHGNQHHHNFDMTGFHHHDGGTGIGVSPVPEPSNVAMLLAGLVVLVSLARRKSNTRAASSSNSFTA